MLNPEEHPDTAIDTAYGRLYVTVNIETYKHWVRQGKVAFTWWEMLKILDGPLTPKDQAWLFQIKKQRPGVRIDQLDTRSITLPKSYPTP